MNKKIYMLSGLGAGEDSVIELKELLIEQGYQLIYLDLPGQYSNCDISIKSEEEFKRWLTITIPKGSIVMGYSLGADLLLKYLNRLEPNFVIILDGGILGPDFTGLTLQEEQAFCEQHIRENQLMMNPTTISKLLELKYKDYGNVFSCGWKGKLLLLLSDSPEEAYFYKQEVIASESLTALTRVEAIFVEDTSHDLYTEKPERVASEIINFVQMGGRGKITYKEIDSTHIEEIKAIYQRAGWSAYLGDDGKLIKAFDQSLVTIGAFSYDKLIGFVRCIGDGKHAVLIQDLIIESDYKRNGIGRKLMDLVFDRFVDVRWIQVNTDLQDPVANQFYQAIGMQKICQKDIVSYYLPENK